MTSRRTLPSANNFILRDRLAAPLAETKIDDTNYLLPNFSKCMSDSFPDNEVLNLSQIETKQSRKS